MGKSGLGSEKYDADGWILERVLLLAEKTAWRWVLTSCTRGARTIVRRHKLKDRTRDNQDTGKNIQPSKIPLDPGMNMVLAPRPETMEENLVKTRGPIATLGARHGDDLQMRLRNRPSDPSGSTVRHAGSLILKKSMGKNLAFRFMIFQTFRDRPSVKSVSSTDPFRLSNYIQVCDSFILHNDD